MENSGPSSLCATPLTLSELDKLGCLGPFPGSSKENISDKEWTAFYRIWHLSDCADKNKQNVGYLKITKIETGPDAPISLRFLQKVLLGQGQVHRIEVKANCRNDGFNSLISWILSNQTETAAGDVNPAFSIQTSAHIFDNGLQIVRNGRMKEIKITSPLTADWCLMEMVQRLPFKDTITTTFDVLESFSRKKTNHTLSFRKQSTETWKEQSIQTYIFQQIGMGVLPYEYYVDENHRLLAVINGNKALVCDNSGEEIFNQQISTIRKNLEGVKP